jgi:hypothetical protein
MLAAYLGIVVGVHFRHVLAYIGYHGQRNPRPALILDRCGTLDDTQFLGKPANLVVV